MFKVKVIEKKQITDDVIGLSLSCPENFEYEPGQFMSVKITKDGETKARSYSILNDGSKDRLDFVIKLVKHGFASSVFKETKEGDEFEVDGPFGHFTFDDKNEKHCFVSVGCGISPIYGMIKNNLSKSKKLKLIAGFEKRSDLLFHEEFVKIGKENNNFEYLPTLTREEWDGARGRVIEHLNGDLSGTTFYLCGLKDMVLEAKKKLLSLDVKEEDIKSESFA